MKKIKYYGAILICLVLITCNLSVNLIGQKDYKQNNLIESNAQNTTSPVTVLWDKYVYGDEFCYTVAKVKDGYIVGGTVSSQSSYLAKYNENGEMIWKKRGDSSLRIIREVISFDDYIITVSSNGTVAKFNLEGNKQFENKDKKYNYLTAIKLDDGIVAASNQGAIVKYNLDGSVAWENTEKDLYYSKVLCVNNTIVAFSDTGEIIVYDMSGNLVKEETNYTYEFNDAVDTESGIATVTYYGDIIFLDYNLNVLLEIPSDTEYYNWILTKVDDGIVLTNGGNGNVLKYDFNGNFIWNHEYRTYKNQDIITDGNDFVCIAEYNQLVKYDLNGEIVFENHGSNYGFEDIEKGDDGYYAVSRHGQVLKYDFDGILVWCNDEVYSQYSQILIVDEKLYAFSINWGWNLKLDKNGKILDKFKTDDFYSKVKLYNDKIYCMTNDGEFYVYDKEMNLLYNSNSLNPSASYSYYYDFAVVNDGIILVDSYDGIVMKYDLDLTNVLWRNTEKSDNSYYSMVDGDDYIIAIGENSDKDGVFVKYNINDGKIITEKSGFQSNSAVSLKQNDGIIIGARNGIPDFVKLDFDGNVIWEFNYRGEQGGYCSALAGKDDEFVAVTIHGAITKMTENEITIDRGELDKVLEDVGKLEETDYSDESWNKLQQAIQGTDDLTDQTEIDQKVEEIKEAIENLTTDRTALDEILKEVAGLTESDYSDDSWNKLQEAIQGTDNLTKQSEIDAKVDEIRDAIENLTTDRTALDEILKEVAGLTESDYSDDSWNKLQEAIQGTDNLTKQSEIDAKVDEIRDAITNLTTDRTALDEILEEVAGLTESDYSDDSWNKLQEAIQGTDNLTKQSEIDAKVDEIRDAITNLTTDRTALDEILEEVAGLTESDYSDDSWNKLQEAIQGTDNLTKQSEIDAKVDEIRDAISNLEKDEDKLDTEELERLLDKINRYNPDCFTKESWNDLQECVDSVGNIEDLKTQEEIDKKVEELNEKINNLVFIGKKGDLDRNGIVNSDDAAIALDLYRYGNATELDYIIGDMDENRLINSDDAALILDVYRYGK